MDNPGNKWWKRNYSLSLLVMLVILGGYTTYREWIGEAITLSGYKVTGIKNTLEENRPDLLPTQAAVKAALNELSLSGGNPLEIINIRSKFIGKVNEATVVGKEDTARGTNIGPFINAAMKEAKTGQLIFIPAGEWVCWGVNSFQNKQVKLVCYGNLHVNKRDLIKILGPQPKGPDRIHHAWFYGDVYGRENIGPHNKSAASRSSPNYSAWTNTFFEVINSHKNFCYAANVQGFGNGYVISGSNGIGSQENTLTGTWFANATDILLRSLDGQSFVDKNYFGGPSNGTWRLSGGLGIKIDGWAGKAANGEQYNGSFLSNEFHVMLEHLDAGVIGRGDIRETKFDIDIEAGKYTNIFGDTAFSLLTTGPNYARNTRITAYGFWCTQWMTQGLGKNTVSDAPVYHNCQRYMGNRWTTDDSGLVVIEVPSNMSQHNRSQLPPNFRTINSRSEEERSVAINTGAYTPLPKDRYIEYDHPAGKLTLPNALDFPQRLITIINKNANKLFIANNGPNQPSVVPGYKSMTVYSNGTGWLGL